MGDGNNKVAAAKDQSPINTLSITQVRLPLGHSATDTTSNPATMFTLWVPTADGGDLSLDLVGTGEMTLYASDGTTVVAGPAKTGLLQHHLVPGTDKKPVHGRYYLFVKGSSPRTVKCGFTQTANARDGTSAGAPPLIPWNFFFWPSAKVFDDGEPNPNISTMEAILAKYERAYGHKPPTGVQWENAHHFRATGASWFGHCHLSARASILFEQPVDAKVMAPDGASVTFTQEELEFLAAEWVGAWLTTYADFVADKGAPSGNADPKGPWNTATRFIDENGKEIVRPPRFPKRFWHHFLKPSELELPRERFKAAITAAMRALDPGVGTDAEGLAEPVVKSTTERQAIRELFGHMAAMFYAVLAQKMYHEKQALVADLRGDDVGNAPNEVWNHALFKLHASFHEELPADRESIDNECLMVIGVDLVANWDYPEPSSTTPPAMIDVDKSLRVDGADVKNRRSYHVFRLAFDRSTGKLLLKDAQNRWVHCRNGPRGDDLYVPSYASSLLPVDTSSKATKNPGTSGLEAGNVTIELDLVTGPKAVLKVRKRYQK